MKLPILLKQIQGCEICKASLPLGPHPLIQIYGESKILIIGHAPGRVAHETAIPWNDRHGDRLRDGLGVDTAVVQSSEKLLPHRIALPQPSPRNNI